MKIRFAILLSLALIAGATSANFAQEKAQPQFKLVQFHMGLLKKGPKSTAANTPDTARLHQEHVAYVTSLLDSCNAMIAGPLTDDGEIRGVYIFRSQSAEEAKGWAEGDPVPEGNLAVKVPESPVSSPKSHAWWI